MPNSPLRQLKETDFLAKGSERHVFALDDSGRVLVKVMRSKYLRKIRMVDDRSFFGWLKIRRAYALFRREQKALSDVMLRAAIREDMPPVLSFRGYILTEKGLGQVVETIRDAEGKVAPSLYGQLQAGPLFPAQIDALNEFAARIYDWHVVAHDLGPKNIVWNAEDGRYVLVDGFGDRSIIPLKTWNRRLNNRRLDRAFREMAETSGLDWDRAERRFRHG
ncbi:YrbL family protein [Roseivivax sp. THAF30]|uniref:YrbL family protein n=1 Tax=Roseivivax sp. THAF30 TaxID=2587852 RepID=UPI0012692C30|nr:YrbL family protein [Roseivivax sp. THAF30]QFT63238.1 hypothetical protein FIU91_09905 [Roseivivax sp. THAF30]